MTTDVAEVPADAIAFDACQSCGRSDETLRHSSHPYVVSTLIEAGRRLSVGTWCERCRMLESTKAMTISLLAGWWSLQGPRATFESVAANLRGGIVPSLPNAELQRGLGASRLAVGDLDSAARSLRAAQTLKSDVEVGRTLYSLTRSGHKGELPKSSWRMLPASFMAVFAVVVLTAVTSIVMRPKPAEVPRQETAKPRKAVIRPGSVPMATWQNQKPAVAPTARSKAVEQLVLARNTLQLAMKNGDPIWPVITIVKELRTDPQYSAAVASPSASAALEKLEKDLNEANRYYSVGGSMEAIERTARENYGMTLQMAMTQAWQEYRGNFSVSNALGSEVDVRAASIHQQLEQLHLRATILAIIGKEIDECAKALR